MVWVFYIKANETGGYAAVDSNTVAMHLFWWQRIRVGDSEN